MKSLSGHPKNWFCKTKALRKTPVERRGLVHGRIVKRIIFGKVFISKMTHNLVFAGQPRCTATLPQHGHGPGLKHVLVSVCSISICYRGWNPLNRMSPSYETRDIQSVGLIFPLAATVGSPIVAVCCQGKPDHYGWLTRCRGETNPVEGRDIY